MCTDDTLKGAVCTGVCKRVSSLYLDDAWLGTQVADDHPHAVKEVSTHTVHLVDEADTGHLQGQTDKHADTRDPQAAASLFPRCPPNLAEYTKQIGTVCRTRAQRLTCKLGVCCALRTLYLSAWRQTVSD